MGNLTSVRKGFMALAGAAIAAVALMLAFVPNAFGATLQSYDLYTTSTGDLDQHVVLELNYDGEVTIDEPSLVASGMTIKIASYDITSSNYNRPVTATASGNTLKLDIGNVRTQNSETGAWENSFTAIYGGVIDVSGTPIGVYADDEEVPAVDIYTVIPTGVHITMNSGKDTNDLYATVDQKANVRGMVHIALYNTATGSWVPVNSSATAGNLGVGTYTTHAHMFTTMTEADLAANIAALSLPAGYSISADGANLHVTGPEGSQLQLYVFDDAMLQDMGWTFSGVVSNEGVMDGYLPGQN